MTRRVPRSSLLCAITATAALLLPAPPAAGQDAASAPLVTRDVARPGLQGGQAAARRRPPRWDIAAHIGGGLDVGSWRGTATLPDPGPSFVTFNGWPSRRIASWYFGDGARLFNELPAFLRLDQTMSPLDPALATAVVVPRTEAALGARVGYAVTRRLTAELTLEYGLGRLEIAPGAVRQIEASRDSFLSGWNGMMAAGTFDQPSVTSAADIRLRRGHQLLTVAALVIKLAERGRWTPFVTGGAGWIAGWDAPDVTLTGRYAFLVGGVTRLDETDRVIVRYELARRLVGMAGGGATYAVRERWGVRADLRAHVGRSPARTLLTAMPEIRLDPPIAAWSASTTSPSVQISSVPEPAASQTNRQSTLGERMGNVETFRGSALLQRVGLTFGWYVRL